MTVSPFETRGIRGRILLVEDASVLREIHLLLLRSGGYQVVACEEPEQALGHVDLRTFDLVVLNSDRAATKTEEFISDLQRNNPRVQIVAVVWNGSDDMAAELMRRGATVIVERPATPTLLLPQINGIMTAGRKSAPAAMGLEPRDHEGSLGARLPLGHEAR